MDTEEIDEYARKNNFLNKIYCGVYSVDKLPMKRIKEKCLIIINNCNSDVYDDACHWIACYLTEKCVYFMDTSGTLSYKENKNFKRFIEIQQKRIESLNHPIQSLMSDRCGLFVLVFGYCMSINMKFSSFVKLFDSKNLTLNDVIVFELFKFAFFK